MAKPRITKNSLKAGFPVLEEETLSTRRALKSKNSRTMKAKKSKEAKKKTVPKKQKPAPKEQATSSATSSQRMRIKPKSLKAGYTKPNVTTRSKNPDAKSNAIKNKVNKSEVKQIDSASLECGVCFELFVEPVTLKCKHSFCKYCVQQVKHTIGVDSCCPLCRGSLDGGVPAKKITQDIKSYIKTQPKPRRESYASLTKKRKADCQRLPNTVGAANIPHPGVMNMTPNILVYLTSLNQVSRSVQAGGVPSYFSWSPSPDDIAEPVYIISNTGEVNMYTHQ